MSPLCCATRGLRRPLLDARSGGFTQGHPPKGQWKDAAAPPAKGVANNLLGQHERACRLIFCLGSVYRDQPFKVQMEIA